MAFGLRLRGVCCVVMCGVAAGLLALTLGAQAQAEPPAERINIAIIVHPENQTADLTLDRLRALFNLDTRFWPNGRPVQVVLAATGLPERDVLMATVYRQSAPEVAERWRQRIFAGEISAAPRGAGSPEALVRAVATEPEAIAAVRASAVTDKVRVLRIDGKLPNEVGYPLR